MNRGNIDIDRTAGLLLLAALLHFHKTKAHSYSLRMTFDKIFNCNFDINQTLDKKEERNAGSKTFKENEQTSITCLLTRVFVGNF